LASAGRAVHQRVGDRPAQLPNRLVGEDRSRASEPVDADIQDSQRLLQLRDLGLNGWVFSCLDLPKGVAKRADFRRQALSSLRNKSLARSASAGRGSAVKGSGRATSIAARPSRAGEQAVEHSCHTDVAGISGTQRRAPSRVTRV
jgi:hypothetical protein